MGQFIRKQILPIGIVCILCGFIYVCMLMFFWPDDVSASRVEKRHIFGATYMTMNNPYYDVLDQRLREQIEANGDVLLKRDAAMNQQRQNEEIQEMINAGAELIFMVPVEWDTALQGLQIAADAGVPVIILDAPVQDTDLVASSIISDNYTAGVLCAEHLVSEKESGKILLLEHTTAYSGKERIRGFTDTIAQYPEFEIVGSEQSDGQIENAMEATASLLNEHPEADVVMALNDPSAFGAMAAIEGAGMSGKVSVYSVDGSPEAKVLIQENVMTASCAQFPYKVALKAVEDGYKLIQGKEVDKMTIIPVKLITKENVDQYDLTGWQ